MKNERGFLEKRKRFWMGFEGGRTETLRTQRLEENLRTNRICSTNVACSFVRLVFAIAKRL